MSLKVGLKMTILPKRPRDSLFFLLVTALLLSFVQYTPVTGAVHEEASSGTLDLDTLGRWGGEEFLVICPSTTLKEALRLAEGMRAMLADYRFIEVGKKTASFGVASQIPGDTLHSIISRSDKALYTAKENGRNRVEFLEIGQDEEALQH